ncbi:MAG: double zinc ribbon domain-containing protein, partial [Pseudomonadales bacterium]|nr:double zinc ribbon domain-containing protein [Pseudomonadales bacterium]
MSTRFRERRWQLALLPPHCCLCDLPADDDRDLCRSCAADLPAPGQVCRRCGEPLPRDALPWPCGRCQRRPPPWHALQARCRWSPPAATIVHRLKFGGHGECARVMAELMIETPPPFLAPDAVLVPVPLHWRRRWRRGFDQARLLTAELARLTGQPLHVDALRRRRATAAQSGLPARRRRRALKGAFEARSPPLPEHVVLVDDVATTGATLAAAA